jgi:hypothetical protein
MYDALSINVIDEHPMWNTEMRCDEFFEPP